VKALVVCAGGGIGDSIFASIVARALHLRYASVDALTLPAHREALHRVPDFDGVLTDDGDEEKALVSSVKARGYDAAVVTWATARGARVARLARIPVRVGQARRLYSSSFTTRVRVRSEFGNVTAHWTQILLDYARALGCDSPDTQPRFVPTSEDEDAASAVMERNGLHPGNFVVLHPCNAIAARVKWPTAGWRAVARTLCNRLGMRVAITGDHADAAIAREIAAPADDRDCDVVSLAGETGIGAFGALAKRASAFVGITTGAMHVAAAVGCPTVGVFPFQSDFPERWAPLGERTAIVRASYPCHKGDTKERCKDYACIAHLNAQGIAAVTGRVLK
jgi:ADP-heptose:LPS heptosyltransferase